MCISTQFTSTLLDSSQLIDGAKMMTYKRFNIYPMKRKPISARRAREFKDRWSKRFFGDRKSRTIRWVYIMRWFPKMLKKGG